MRTSQLATRCTMGIAIALTPALAAGQAPVNNLPVAVGQKVQILSGPGWETRGKVVGVTPTTVEVEEDGQRASVPAAQVTRIKISDPVWDGALKGGLVFGVLGGLAGAGASSASKAIGCGTGDFLSVLFTGAPSAGRCDTSSDLGSILAGVAIGGGVGALIGAGLDSLKKKTVFERRVGAASVSWQPMVSPAGQGLGVQVRW